MRFHRLEIENLNSFYGVHEVDFDRDVGGAAVFLIVGPTGAGKSTLLDAISLSLFGQTPRLDRKSGDPAREVSNIISIGTGNARAELDFSMRAPDGRRRYYKAKWTIRRARDSPDGVAQRPERSLFTVVDGAINLVVSDHRAKFFQPAFDEVLMGVGIDDFKRSVILAQGEFSSFLHASDADKASILERLTNTETYRKIGAKAASIKRSLEQDWRLKRERLGESTNADPIDVVAVTARLAILEGRVTLGRVELDHFRRAWSWSSDHRRLEQALAEAVNQAEKSQVRLEERSSAYAKLDADAQLRPAIEPMTRLAQLRADAELTISKMKVAAEVLAKRGAALTAAQRRLDSAKDALIAVRDERSQTVPKLDDAEKILAALSENRQALRAAVKDAGDARFRAQQLKERGDDLVTRIKGLSQEQARIAEAIVTGRSGNIETLETLFEEALVPAFEGFRAREAAVSALEVERDSLRQAAESQRLASSERRRRRGPIVAQVTRYQNKLSELAQGRPEEFRAERDREASEVAKKVDALREAARHVQTISELEAERAELHETLAGIRADVETISDEKNTVKALEAEQRTGVERAAGILKANRQVALLVELRRGLVMGEACALCGSPLHPFCESDELRGIEMDAREDLGRLEAELEGARERLRETNFRMQQLTAHFVSRTTSLRHEEGRLVAVSQALERAQMSFSRCVEDAGYSPLEAFQLKDAKILNDAAIEAEASFKNMHTALSQFDNVRRQLEGAVAKLEDFDRREGPDQLDAVAQQVDRVEERLELARQEVEAAQLGLAQRRSDFESSLRMWGVKEAFVSLDEATKCLALARKGHAEAAALEGRQDALSKTLGRLEASIAENAKQREEAGLEAAKRDDRVRAIEEPIAVKEAQVHAILKGREPAEVKQELAKREAVAQAEQDAAGEAVSVSLKLEAEEQARLEVLKRNQQEATEAIAMWSTTLVQVLDALGVSEETARQALLAPEVRDQLERERAGLEERRAMYQQQAQQARASLDEHKKQRVHDETLDPSLSDIESLEAALNADILSMGGLREQLERAQNAGKRREEIVLELTSIESELERWRAVADLIGVRDGASFKLFAQTLNLQGLVDRANKRLVNLHPRYALAVPRGDKPSLTFMVRDRYRADRERPLSTLSGGETFLVSLALALALSDYRRIDFPVETLLMDEGFGTLDQDSLQMALSTLHRLHLDGSRQIGIISHVDSLRDMVDTRIVIEKSGQGRSHIRVERGGESG